MLRNKKGGFNYNELLMLIHSQIDPLFKNLKINQELEISCFDYIDNKQLTSEIGFEQYLKIFKYMKARSQIDKIKLEQHVVEDVIYSKQTFGSQVNNGESYRITLEGLDEINNSYRDLYNRNNHVIFKALCVKLGASYLTKKNKENVIDISELFAKAKVSSESKVTKEELKMLNAIDHTEREKIIFRYKQRISLLFDDNDKYTMRLDLTYVKASNYVNALRYVDPGYEVELEFFKKSDKIDEVKLAKTYVIELLKLIKVMQSSNTIITKSLSDHVFKKYIKLFELDITRTNMLEAMQSVSLEIQHIIDQLPNQYNVTDKADGDRCFLIVVNETVYLISNTLHITNTGIQVSKEFNDTVLDGELIYLSKYKKYVFLAFDILFDKGTNMRDTQSLLIRLNVLTTLLQDMTGKLFTTHVSKIVKLQGDELANFYKNDLTEYFTVLESNLNKAHNMIIYKKYFMNPTGVLDNEVFKFAQVFWETNKLCPYKLDGLIFTPLEQKYTKNVWDAKKPIYKWKPPYKNSIDFYVKFIKDPDTNEVLTLFDGSDDSILVGKTYRIAHLHVGQVFNGMERYVPFQKNFEKYIAYLYLQNGDIRDLDGNPIRDGTVVEFYYNNVSNDHVQERFRWVPIRTRYDKTESVKKFNKKYGNSVETANRIWRSIINPITMDDINSLANNSNYSRHSALIKNKISKGLIALERTENVFYQYQSHLMEDQRNFHNWEKSNWIYTIFSPRYAASGRTYVLDFGCGRGGDIPKMFYARVDKYVGIDIDSVGIHSTADGAISRYEQNKLTRKNFPLMHFIHADACTDLNVVSQEKTLGTMTEQNKNVIRQFFENNPDDKRKYQRFNRINCQFTIQFFLKNSTSWNTFCSNVNKYMEPGGYMLVSCFDAHALIKTLGNKNIINGYHTNAEGNKILLYEVIKKFNLSDEDIKTDKILGTGLAIDYHNSSYQEDGKYETEYLVDRRFLEREFKDKCNMILVETAMFSKLFHINREYFMKTAHWEEYFKTRNYLLKTKKFYTDENEMNTISFEMTKLYRYFIFHKLPEEKDEYEIKYAEWKSDSDYYKKKVPHKTRFENKNKTESVQSAQQSRFVSMKYTNYKYDSKINEFHTTKKSSHKSKKSSHKSKKSSHK
jgi:SAM-dependent methyltransferase